MVRQVLVRLCSLHTVRIAGLILAGLLATSTPGWAQFGGVEVAEQQVLAPGSVPSFPRPTAAEAKILQQLAAPTTVNWTDKSFEEALSDLEHQHGIEVWINKQALSEEGIDSDQPITLKMNGITLRSCLKLMLEPMGLVYVIEDDVLKVTSYTVHGTKKVTRVYPVGDLCETAEEAQQLLETIECGLGVSRQTDETPRFVISSKMKTLTVRDSYTAQEKVQQLILALRDAQAANNSDQ